MSSAPKTDVLPLYDLAKLTHPDSNRGLTAYKAGALTT